MNTSKKTAFGILGVAATTALVAGASLPAMADDRDSSTTSSWSEYTTMLTGALQGGDLGFSNESPVVIAPETNVGDVLGGDILSGNETGNGNVVGSGNDTAIGSGNTTAIDGVDATVSDVVDSTVGDITGDVSGMVDGLIGDLDLDITSLFED